MPSLDRYADNTLWTFETERFTVICTAEEEFDLDLSWDDSGEVADKLERGVYVVFCAKVAVYACGVEIAADYLGGCVYENATDFVTGHRDKNPMNRNCATMRATHGGNVSICHYFPDMVSIAVKEARKFLHEICDYRFPPCRAA